jgi:branched-chain amino acid transport system permease protein
MSGLKRASAPSLLALLVVVVIFTAAGLSLTQYWMYVASLAAGQAVFGLSIGLVYGQAGMLSLCQVSLGAVGAWAVAYLSQPGGSLGMPWSLLVGALLTVPLGVICALPALRLRKIYLAIVTLGVVLAIYTVAQAGQVPGSNPSISVAPPSNQGLFLLCWLSFAVLAAITIVLRRTRWGLSWLAIARSERAAASVGVSVTLAKITAFAVAAAIAGWAGGLLVATVGSADPASFDPIQVLTLFALAVMMGAGYWEGALALGFFNAFSAALLSQFHLSPDIGTVLFAVGAVGVLGAESGGFSGDVRRLLGRLQRRLGRGPKPMPEAVLRAAEGPGAAEKDHAVAADAPMVLGVTGLTVRYGAVVALADVSLQVRRGEVVGLVGPNGAGKSTLVDAATGFLASYEGSVQVAGQPVDRMPAHRRAHMIRRTFQTERTIGELTPREYVRLAAARHVPAHEIDEILDFVGCPPTTLTLNHIDVRVRRLIMIAACLAGRPSAVLIDEPAAGLTAEESEDLAVRIAEIPARFNCGVLLIDHDMELVRRACSSVVVLDFGRVIAHGPTAEVLSNPVVAAAYLGDELLAEHAGSAIEQALIASEEQEAAVMSGGGE